MDTPPGTRKTPAELLAQALVEIADNNAHLLTLLDLQARILARLEERDPDEVVDEVNALLKERRRAAVQEIEAWALGTRTPIDDDEASGAE